ncbi:MAG: hypothetical protein ACKN9D_09440 [Actinomycetales bacterium]
MNDEWASALGRLADRVEDLAKADESPADRGKRSRGGHLGVPAVPGALQALTQYLPLDAVDTAILLCTIAPALDPWFEQAYERLNRDR